MKLRLSGPRTSLRRAAFTLVEMSVAMAVAVAIGLTAFNALRTGLLLSSQNTGINVSSFRGRTIIDQIGIRARYALEQPALIDSDGTDPTTPGAADGLLIKRLLGDPYVVKDASGGTADIAATAKQFVLEYRATLPAPQVGDCLLIESVTRPQVEISAVSTMAASGSVQRRLVTITTAAGELLQPSKFRNSAQLYRKEAYVFVNIESVSNPHAELRHYERVTGSTAWGNAASYGVMARDFRRLNNQTYFLSGSSNGSSYTLVQAVCNSTLKQETVARGNAASAYTSVPVSLRLWAVNR